MARFQEDEQAYLFVVRLEKSCENNVFVGILLAVAAKPHIRAGFGAISTVTAEEVIPAGHDGLIARSTHYRHARTWCGHPRLNGLAAKEGVDTRPKGRA